MLKLHFAPNSRAGRIVWLLEELDLPYEINKWNKTEEKLNPTKTKYKNSKIIKL